MLMTFMLFVAIITEFDVKVVIYTTSYSGMASELSDNSKISQEGLQIWRRFKKGSVLQYTNCNHSANRTSPMRENPM